MDVSADKMDALDVEVTDSVGAEDVVEATDAEDPNLQ